MTQAERDRDRAEQLSRLMMMLPKCSTSALAGLADALEHDLMEAALQSEGHETLLSVFAPAADPVMEKTPSDVSSSVVPAG